MSTKQPPQHKGSCETGAAPSWVTRGRPSPTVRCPLVFAEGPGSPSPRAHHQQRGAEAADALLPQKTGGAQGTAGLVGTGVPGGPAYPGLGAAGAWVLQDAAGHLLSCGLTRAEPGAPALESGAVPLLWGGGERGGWSRILSWNALLSETHVFPETGRR